MLGRTFRKLKQDDIIVAEGFLLKNQDMDKNDFALAIVRMFMDKPKPKNWKLIEELLICANSALPAVTPTKS